MKRLINLFCLLMLVCMVEFASTVQPAFASNHAYLNLEQLECPNTGGSGYIRYALKWRTQDEDPAHPELHQWNSLWPSEPSDGDCGPGAGRKVIAINEEYQFLEDRNLEGQLYVGGGSTEVGQPFLIPATEGDHENVTLGTGGYQGVLDFDVPPYHD